LRDFGLELWKNPWVFDKFAKFSSKASIFMGILYFTSEPKLPLELPISWVRVFWTLSF
jgi:hypothetical protein